MNKLVLELIDAELKLANARIQSGAKAATYDQAFVVDRGEKP